MSKLICITCKENCFFDYLGTKALTSGIYIYKRYQLSMIAIAIDGLSNLSDINTYKQTLNKIMIKDFCQ